MNIYYYICPDKAKPFTDEEKALFPLLSREKQAICSDGSNKTARMSFYGEIFALWLWRRANPHATALPRVRYTPQGKPFIEGGEFYSLSHKERGIFFATSPHTPVGIDAELPRPLNRALAGRYFPQDYQKELETAVNKEETYATLWTRIEAYGKFLGKGISHKNPPPPSLPSTLTVEGYILSVYPPAEELTPIPLSPQEVCSDLKKFLK